MVRTTNRGRPFLAGVAAKISDLTPEDQLLMRQAGLHWLRCDLDPDQRRFLQGQGQSEDFEKLRKKVLALKEAGFHLIGITPGPRKIIAEAGEPGTPGYFDYYRRLCAWIGREFQGLIEFWQVANELDIWIFRGALTLEHSAEFLRAGLRGLKDADPNLKVGINVTLFPSSPGEVDGNTELHEGVFIARSIYEDPTLEIDYAGFDSYPGTWRRGGAKSWSDFLDAFHDLVKKPVIVQEFGYASAGTMMTREEALSGASPCELKKWKFAWKGAHTPEIQADFIAESYRTFAEKPFVLGAIYYCWKDSAACWQCGSPDCPAETAWGLLDSTRHLKPSYHRLKASLAELFSETQPEG